MRNLLFTYAKTKTPISCLVTTQLISTFVFSTYLVQFLDFLATQCIWYKVTIKLELMFMKHYAPNRCLYIKVAKFRTGVGSAEMSHLQNCSLQIYLKRALGGGGGGGSDWRGGVRLGWSG